MTPRIPDFETDEQAEAFAADADLTAYDPSGARPMLFEVERKQARVNMRLPQGLLAAVKQVAAERGIPYQRFIREALEGAISRRRG